uniref:Uncharacterized protein n=1 Tax=Timema douglasi TaxID=61478 RepID=A0A7R8ZA78_TIMDO|nr:unnamed protein product [Timema douglasi]
MVLKSSTMSELQKSPSVTGSTSSLLSPDSPSSHPKLQVPSPIITRRTRTDSTIEGEYVPLPGDEVQFRLCPIPPKFEKFQAVHVHITNLTPEVHIRWDCPQSDESLIS